MTSSQASNSYESGTFTGTGFGNKTNEDPDTDGTSYTQLGSKQNTDPYLGGTEYGSGTTAGVGFGNKSTSTEGFTQEHEATRYGSAEKTGAYAGGTRYGSGTTGGAGFGNKTSGSRGGSDGSFVGRIMEKTGNVLGNEGIAEKGRQKCDEEGHS
ncbi:MAG: hypothetical protein M1822_007522 [Bathelium mastoideum]|nr:MAG: hypothetical protein M1822_007522 [Bathelium mastoideum]